MFNYRNRPKLDGFQGSNECTIFRYSTCKKRLFTVYVDRGAEYNRDHSESRKYFKVNVHSEQFTGTKPNEHYFIVGYFYDETSDYNEIQGIINASNDINNQEKAQSILDYVFEMVIKNSSMQEITNALVSTHQRGIEKGKEELRRGLRELLGAAEEE